MAWYKPKDIYEKGKDYVQRGAAQAKQYGRSTAEVRTKITRVATGVGAGAIAFVPGFGAFLAPAVATLGAGANRYNAATAARHDGKTGRDARQVGRKEMIRTGLYGMAGAALGIGATALTGTGSFASSAPKAAGYYDYSGGQAGFVKSANLGVNEAAELTMSNYAAAGGPSSFGVSPSAGGFSGSLGNFAKAAGQTAKTVNPSTGGFLDSLGSFAGDALKAAAPVLSNLPKPPMAPGGGTWTPPFNPGGQSGGQAGGDQPGGQPGVSGWAGDTGSGAVAGAGGGALAIAAIALLLLSRRGR